MQSQNRSDRIVRDPAILVGKPIIRGTRIPVSLITNYIENGHPVSELLSDYPDLTIEDVEAAIQYAAERARESLDFAS